MKSKRLMGMYLRQEVTGTCSKSGDLTGATLLAQGEFGVGILAETFITIDSQLTLPSRVSFEWWVQISHCGAVQST